MSIGEATEAEDNRIRVNFFIITVAQNLGKLEGIHLSASDGSG